MDLNINKDNMMIYDISTFLIMSYKGHITYTHISY